MGLELYYKAFFDLSSCRTGLHGSEGPILWTALDRWAEKYELDEEQWEDLVYYIGQMDEVKLRRRRGNANGRYRHRIFASSH